MKPQPRFLWSLGSDWNQQDTPRYLRACVNNAALANEELQLAWQRERWNWVAVAVRLVIICITSNESIKDQKQLPQPVKVNTLMSLVSLSQWIMSVTKSPYVVFLLVFFLSVIYLFCSHPNDTRHVQTPKWKTESRTHYSYSHLARLETLRCVTQQASWSFAVGLATPEGSVCPSHLKDMPPACFIVEAVWLNVLLLKIVFSLWQSLQINRPNSNVGRSRRAVAAVAGGPLMLTSVLLIWLHL